MRLRKAVLGAAGISVLTVTSVVGTIVGQDELARIASTLLVAAVGLLVIDGTVALRRTERQVRRVRSVVRDVASRPAARPRESVKVPPRAETLPATSTADLIGTIKLLQAQYVGRLDRMQAALDAAIERMPADDRKE